jgi:hypothetical protein
MAIENDTNFQKVTETLKSTLSGLGTHVQAAIEDLEKIQDKGLEQARNAADAAARATQEQLAFAEQIGAEWRKLMLAATRSATELFTRNA